MNNFYLRHSLVAVAAVAAFACASEDNGGSDGFAGAGPATGGDSAMGIGGSPAVPSSSFVSMSR